MAGIGEPGRYEARVRERIQLSADAFELSLERPAGFSFLPGQGIKLSIDEGLEREYSLIGKLDDDHLSICFNVVTNGALSPLLARLEAGARVSFSGPHGYFTFQYKGGHPVFVATGMGIAPFVAMVRAGTKGFTLLHGASTVDGLYYRKTVQPAASKYVACITRESGMRGEDPWRYSGRVSDFLRKILAAGIYDFYASGAREMVRDVVSIVDERFPGSRVFFEIFF